MCGIIGSTSPEALIETALSELGRGNDGQEVRRYGDLAVGCRRHAVISPLSTTNQPQDSGEIATVANGELFEHEVVGKHLPGGGDSGLGRTDIEILHQYALFKGVPAVAELDMMMAAAICTKDGRHTHLFRDWVGEMPLHYTIDPVTGEWCFASTIAGVINCIGCEASQVAEVPPGSIVEITSSGSETHRYFDVRNLRERPPESYAGAVDRTRTLLEDAARARNRADVPIAALVSGGVDSLITTWLLLHSDRTFAEPLPIYTFHCSDHPDDEGSDLYHARRVAEFFGDRVDHRIVTANRQEIVEAVPKIVEALEDRRCRDFNVITGVYNYFLARRLAADGIKVVFEGEGADEALGAYSAWGSFEYEDAAIREPGFRRRLVSNLHKGVLLRTSKVMMKCGPVECRSFFLDRRVMTHLVSMPADVVQSRGRRKGLLVDAFSEEIPQELLERPKSRPQDVTGITATLSGRPDIGTEVLRGHLEGHFRSLQQRWLSR